MRQACVANVIAAVFMSIMPGISQADGPMVMSPVDAGLFELIREPSGVTALNDDTLIVVEDESRRALRRLQRAPETDGFQFTEFKQATGAGFIQRQLLGPLDDLEGIARLSANRFFVIGSHENASRGTQPAREKLVLFTRNDNTLVSAAMRRDLFDQLDRHYPVLGEKLRQNKNRKQNTLNIEGLAYDRKRGELLIGLRSPTLDDDAIIIRLLNAVQYLDGEEPLFADELQLLDLDKGGIRAIAYDDQSDRFLIASERESGGKERSSLWSVPADSYQPARIRSQRKHQFDDVEGLTPLADTVFFVRDSGGGKSRYDEQWFVFPRSQLGLDE